MVNVAESSLGRKLCEHDWERYDFSMPVVIEAQVYDANVYSKDMGLRGHCDRQFRRCRICYKVQMSVGYHVGDSEGRMFEFWVDCEIDRGGR